MTHQHNDAPSTSSPYLSVALEIAEELATQSIPTESGPTWEGDDLEGDDTNHKVVRRFVGSDLYGGTAGIAWFLGHVARFEPTGALARIASEAMCGAVTQAKVGLNDGATSLLVGSTGTVLAALDLADELRLAGLHDSALSLARDTCDQVARESMREVDLIGGLAGVVIGLLAIYRRCDDPILIDACRAVCDQLLERMHSEWWGDSIPEGENAPALCGLAHGMSSIGWAFAEMAWISGMQRYRAAAKAVFRYERSWFSLERCAWPDLRDPKRETRDRGAWPGWMTAWCHGALGIGAVRLRLYERTRDKTALAEASAAIQAARLMAMQAGAAFKNGGLSDVTLCHGLGGVIELFTLAYEIFAVEDHLRAARQVGRLCLDMYKANGHQWTCGLVGAKSVPGLFLGRAGIGATFIRLHDPSLIASPALPGRAWLCARGTTI